MKNLLLVALLCISGGLVAQLDLFQPHTPKRSDTGQYVQKIIPTKASYFEVSSPAELAKAIKEAPTENTFSQGRELLLTLPDPEGRKATFRITRYQMISDELQAVYPSYTTAFGWDIAAPHRKIFLDWTGLGFGASITGGEEGRWYIEPLYHQEKRSTKAFSPVIIRTATGTKAVVSSPIRISWPKWKPLAPRINL